MTYREAAGDSGSTEAEALERWAEVALQLRRRVGLPSAAIGVAASISCLRAHLAGDLPLLGYGRASWGYVNTNSVSVTLAAIGPALFVAALARGIYVLLRGRRRRTFAREEAERLGLSATDLERRFRMFR